jgi:hypothetical protein
MKVSDEFTVPLCRGHHRQLHQAGNEVVWWENLKINALEIAQGLWEQTHPDLASAVLDHTGDSKARAPESNDAMTATGGKSQNRSAAGNTDNQAPSDGERE